MIMARLLIIYSGDREDSFEAAKCEFSLSGERERSCLWAELWWVSFQSDSIEDAQSIVKWPVVTSLADNTTIMEMQNLEGF